MDERSFGTLELPKILDRLAAFTSFSAGRELAVALRPTADFYEAREWLRGTAEARHLLDLNSTIGLGGARDVRPFVHRAVVGGRLEPSELLEVLSTLQSARSLRVAISRRGDEMPTLANVAAQLADCPYLEGEIARCINERAEVAAEASPALGRIRSGLRGARERLINRLSALLNSADYRLMIQEPIITQRQGRYVVPVKAEFKGKFHGIVHDQSSSGATLFVEPLATVELNNRVRELELAEGREVDRILRELSAQVAVSRPHLDGNVAALALLDLALAKARYANQIRATQPELVAGTSSPDNEPALLLINARHPLIGEHVVPISVRLGGDFRALVITGPNTGGKTVALKTVGLLTLMAQSGMHIPAEGGSRVPILRDVHADIGDEQSIEQSLSTFSSHMRNVVNILRVADTHSLVLLDELGAGTDPAEGAALAQSILDFLLQRGALVMATTHYSELKAYAHSVSGVENASVEFDVETLTPTYRLAIGLPGRSNALAIATRLGLMPAVIDAALSRLRPDEAAVERMLAEIQEERDRAVCERLEAQQRNVDADRLRLRLEARMAAIDREREAIVAAAQEEAQATAARELGTVRDQLREVLAATQRPVPDRAVLLEGLRDVQRAERALEERRDRERARRVPTAPRPVAPAPTGPLRVGDLVLVGSLDQQGELLSLPEGGEAEVQVGNFKMRVSAADLRRIGRAKASVEFQERAFNVAPRSDVPLEIQVRGWRAEEVPPVLDKYIHDAFLAGLPHVRVVHGKGTGVLRRLVREQLSANPLVQTMYHPEPRDGGEGVTVVELAS